MAIVHDTPLEKTGNCPNNTMQDNTQVFPGTLNNFLIQPYVCHIANLYFANNKPL